MSLFFLAAPVLVAIFLFRNLCVYAGFQGCIWEDPEHPKLHDALPSYEALLFKPRYWSTWRKEAFKELARKRSAR